MPQHLRDTTRTVAFYLPQFHAIPENDEWWGPGFTEWTNVNRAVAVFVGHRQPRAPGSLGHYDLSATNVDTMQAQVDLATSFGVDAFCFYHYWFDGRRLLERPVERFLRGGSDISFCIAWANENWTRRWDGKSNHILIGQSYGSDMADEVFKSFLPSLLDPRYLRVGGAAVLLVHRLDHIPKAKLVADRWRTLSLRHGVGALHLVASETQFGLDPRAYGFDAVAEFPPVGANTLSSALLLPVRGLDPKFRGRLMSYDRVASRYKGRRHAQEFVRYAGVMPDWDNSARRGLSATIYVGSTPAKYGAWIKAAREKEQRQRGGAGLVFINAWNEWAEGAYLEPDTDLGDAYLNATLGGAGSMLEGPPFSLRPTYPFLHSLALAGAGSALKSWRGVRKRLR